MKQTYIHFIGKSYYTIPTFIKEAEQIGTSRAVSANVFRKMQLGDTILLAHKDGPTTKIFGYFILSSITGLTEGAISTFLKAGLLRLGVALTPMRIQRGCGHYDITAMYTITDAGVFNDAISQLTDDEIGRVMVGGKFHPLKDLDMNVEYILCDIPFRQGFRLFDYETFKWEFDMSYQSLKPGHHVKLNGQFYTNEEGERQRIPVINGQLLQIENYQLN